MTLSWCCQQLTNLLRKPKCSKHKQYSVLICKSLLSEFLSKKSSLKCEEGIRNFPFRPVADGTHHESSTKFPLLCCVRFIKRACFYCKTTLVRAFAFGCVSLMCFNCFCTIVFSQISQHHGHQTDLRASWLEEKFSIAVGHSTQRKLTVCSYLLRLSLGTQATFTPVESTHVQM